MDADDVGALQPHGRAGEGAVCPAEGSPGVEKEAFAAGKKTPVRNHHSRHVPAGRGEALVRLSSRRHSSPGPTRSTPHESAHPGQESVHIPGSSGAGMCSATPC